MAEADIPAQEPSFKDAVPPDTQRLIEKLEIVRLFVISHSTHKHGPGTLRALNDIKVAIVSQQRSDRPSNAPKIAVKIDPAIPEDEIHARTDGKEVGRIVNIGPNQQPSYEEQLATVESMMTDYDTPLTQAAGYVRDLLRTIIALQQREIPEDDSAVKRIATWLREKYDREHETNWNAPDVFESQAREIHALMPDRFRNREIGRGAEVARIADIIDRFWQLHSIEPATGFTPEQLAMEIVK